jgi:hypothetical protein
MHDAYFLNPDRRYVLRMTHQLIAIAFPEASQIPGMLFCVYNTQPATVTLIG